MLGWQKRRFRLKQKAPKPPPQCKAILLCERTIVEHATRNISIIGVFYQFNIGFPGAAIPFSVFMELVNGIGDYDIMVEIHDLTEDKVLARAQLSNINFADRRHRVNLIIPVPALPLAHPGVYDLVVFANNQEIDRQQFVAKLRENRAMTEVKPNSQAEGVTSEANLTTLSVQMVLLSQPEPIPARHQAKKL